MNIIEQIIHRKLNPRWLLGGSHITLLIISYAFFNLQRSVMQILFALVCGLGTEFLFYKFTNKYGKDIVLDRLFSAFTGVAGLLVLLRSHLWWFYGLISVMAISSKYLLRKSENSHIFNPVNLAITLALTFFPQHWFVSWADEYMISWYPMLHVCLFGVIAVWLGKTITISFTYILSVIFCCFLFYPINNISSLVYAIGPEFGAIGLIYLWLMITDPKTAPKDEGHQMIYAFSIAFLHIFLRYHQYLYSRYVALFVVTLFYYALTLYKERAPDKSII